MFTSQDYQEGKGRKVTVKANTSILPYLKAKQVKVEHNPAVKGTEDREEHKTAPTVSKDPYDKARMEIMREYAGEE